MSDETLEAAMASIAARPARLDTRSGGMDGGQTTLLDRLALIGQGLTMLDEGQTKLRAHLVDRIDRLQNIVTAMRDDVAVNFGATDAVRRANDNMREELRGIG